MLASEALTEAANKHGEYPGLAQQAFHGSCCKTTSIWVSGLCNACRRWGPGSPAIALQEGGGLPVQGLAVQVGAHGLDERPLLGYPLAAHLGP